MKSPTEPRPQGAVRRNASALLLVLALLPLLAAQTTPAPLTAADATTEFRADMQAGKIPEAESLARRLLAQEDSADRPESAETQTALDMLLTLFQRRADRASSELEVFGTRAVALREKLQGADSTATAKTLALFAMGEIAQGNQPSARSLVDRSVRIFEDREKSGAAFSQADRTEYAQSLATLAGILRLMVDMNGAKRAMLKSIALEETLPHNNSRLGNWYMNMGSLEHDTGNHDLALTRFHQARQALLVAEPVNKLLLQALNAQEGRCLSETGHIEEGKPLVEEALREREAVYGPDHPTLAPTIDILREIDQYQGKFVEAKALAERALAIRRKAYGPFHPDIAYGEADIARVLAELGDSKGSLKHAIESDRIAREHLSLNVSKLAEHEATLFVEKRFSALRFAISAALNSSGDAKGETIEPAFDTLIRSRAIVFDELASRHGTRIAPSEDADAIYRLTAELRTARERLSHLSLGAGESAKDSLEEELLAAMEDRDAIERKLAAASVEYRRRIVGRSAGLKEVAASLPEDASLISYVRFQHASKGTIKEPEEYAAFVLARESTIVVGLGPATDIDAAVDELRAKLAIEAAAPGIAAKRNEAAYRAAADNLRRLVWDPIDRYASGSKRIFIVTDGSLYAINFAALPEPGADGKYLIERPTLFHYLSAERDLVTSQANQEAGTGLLAIGNPSFDRPESARGSVVASPATGNRLIASSGFTLRGARSTCAGLQSMQFAPLPSSEVEIDNISHIWKQSAAAGGEVVELTGELAGPVRFKAMAPGKRTIHLAVHGFVAGADCADPVRNENPLLLTGLAFAGANHHDPRDSSEDGILTADEIGAMDLRGVEWAVLSACDTGLGKATQAEGVFGLRRAFQVAGAHTVIMSLWPVEDHVTTEWMRLLYDERLNHHMDTASAVRYASLETLKHRRSAGLGTHPFYWAPFVAVGDWR